MKPGRFYGVGVGPGDPELITLKAARILSSVPFIFVPRKGQESASFARGIISGLVRDGQEIVELIFPMVRDRAQLSTHWQRAAESIWQRLEQGRDCALVNLGDPLLYGTFVHVMSVIKRVHPELEIEVVPGMSSISAAAARALVPLAVENDRVAVLPGDCEAAFIKETLRNFDTVVFMKVNRAFDRLLDTLEELGLVEKCVYVKKCTNQDEVIVTDVRKLKGQKLDYFSLLIVRR